jgi:predicted outer membrane protein
VALRRANDARVRELARHVLGAHEQAKLNTVELSRALGTLPQPSPLSRQLEASAAERQRLLEGSATARVDTTYLKAEIERQAELLSIVRHRLLPAVHDTALAKRIGAEQEMLQDQRAAAQTLYSVLSPVTQPAQTLP